MAYSLNPSADSCYDGTTCLINKFGIKDEQKLAEIEAHLTFAKAVMLEDLPIQGDFGFEHYKRIHEFLFSDLYEWAGKVRTVDISKKRTRFLEANAIEGVAAKCFGRVSEGCLEGLSRDEFALEIATLYNDINFIHPFREGNGRTQRIYFTQLIRHYGYDLDFSAVDTDELMIATIKASQGVIDFLVDFFAENILTIGE